MTLIVRAVISILSCSQSPQNEVNALIQKNVEKTLSHPESYEALQTVVDSAFAPFDDPAFFEKTLEICKMNIEEESDSLAAKIAERGQELIAMMGTEYRFIGYKVTHSYSARDDEGVTFTGEKVYIMDKEALRTVMVMPDWIPAETEDGTPVQAKQNATVNFGSGGGMGGGFGFGF